MLITSNDIRLAYAASGRDSRLVDYPTFEYAIAIGQRQSWFGRMLSCTSLFSVARGYPKGASDCVKKLDFQAAALELKRLLGSNSHLLGFDYSFSFEGDRRSRLIHFLYREGSYSFQIRAKPRGYLVLEKGYATDGKSYTVCAYEDLRVVTGIESTEYGKVFVRRRKTEFRALQNLDQILRWSELFSDRVEIIPNPTVEQLRGAIKI